MMNNRYSVLRTRNFMDNPALENVDVRLLRILLVLLSERSVSRSAQKLDMSQPAMSHVLNRLRRLFADPLLTRSRNGMIHTQRAKEIEPMVRDLLERFDRLMAHEEKFDPATSRRRFVVTSAPYTEHVLLPGLVRRVREHAPGVRMELKPPHYGHAHEQLESGEVDLRLAWGQGPPPLSLRSVLLFHDRIVCVSDKRRNGKGGPLSIAEYLAASHIRAQGAERTTTGKAVDSAVAQYGTTLSIALLVQDYLSVPRMVEGTDFVVTIPQRLARDVVAHASHLEITEPPLRLPRVRMMGYWHERSHTDPAHRWFRSLAIAASRDLGPA
ncbi:LysR family transcriptional regulator [Pigmentiphaga sp. H8]|nr:LysR family transcriptional regulator [Pigmentiphaga sp. H8]